MGFFRIYPSRYLLSRTFLHSTFLSLCKTVSSSPPLFESNSAYFVISSSGYPSFSQFIGFITSKSVMPCGCGSSVQIGTGFFVQDVCLLSNQRRYLSYSSSINTVRTFGEGGDSGHCGFGLSYVDVNQIIDVVKSNRDDLESRLDDVGSKLPKSLIIRIFRVLNDTKVPAMRFFEWIRDVHPNFARNADICSLMVDNCGRLGDYATMITLLEVFRAENICLSQQAFGFLPILISKKETATKYIEGIIKVLNEVGGSCRNSGIHSLLELLCSVNSFDLTTFVLDITERKVSYYNILVRHICVRGQFESAKHVLEEMWLMKCVPEVTTYNLLISSLCKRGRLDEAYSVLEEMLNRGCSPDEITYETFIYFTCTYGRSGHAIEFYDQMVSRGVQPRLPTHYAFIRGYFSAKQFGEAYRYVIDTAAKHPWSAEGIYNVLAGLHLNNGDDIFACKLLIEMMKRALKPRYSLYLKTLKCLSKSGKEEFANDLRASSSHFMSKLGQNNR